jgi:anti-anti-sigma factor
MQVSLQQLNLVDILKISGRLDSQWVEDLETSIDSLINKKRVKLVLDFSDLEYISSAGLRVLVSALKQTRAMKGNVVLANIPVQIQDTLAIVGFNSLFSQYNSILEAVDSYSI